MTATTDLRAALRDAANALASEAANKRATIHAAVFGDGRKLMAVAPLDGRPCYIVVRVDSNTESLTDEPIGDERYLIDRIYDAAEDQFGRCHCEECEEDDPEPSRFPIVHWGDGSSWGEIEWPKPAKHRKAARRG